MRIVLDTNVFVSGVFFSGPPYDILNAWRDGRVEIVVSPEILEEYVRVGEELARGFPGIDLRPTLPASPLTAAFQEWKETTIPYLAASLGRSGSSRLRHGLLL
jgi:predicted nucleic acid-binding protein